MMAMSAASAPPLMSRGSPVLSRLKQLDSMMAYLAETKGAVGSDGGTKSCVSCGSAATWSGGFTSDGGDGSSSSSSDDESSATSRLRPRQSWVSPRLVVSAEEAAAQVRAKGSLLARIGRLEEHVVKLKADMKSRKLESEQQNATGVGDDNEGKTKMEGVKGQRHSSQQGTPRHLLRSGRRRVVPVVEEQRPLAGGKPSGDSKPHSFLFKLLHPRFLLTPSKGCFVPVATSMKTLEKGEQNRKDKGRNEGTKRDEGVQVSGPKRSGYEETATSHRPGKQKGLREVEVQRLLSLQGIQGFSTSYTEQEPP